MTESCHIYDWVMSHMWMRFMDACGFGSWTHMLDTCDGHIWMRLMDTWHGHVWIRFMDTCDGHMSLTHMNAFYGHMWRTLVMDTCGFGSWTHVMDTYECVFLTHVNAIHGHMWWTHAMDTCDGHMWMCVMDTTVRGHMWMRFMDTCEITCECVVWHTCVVNACPTCVTHMQARDYGLASTSRLLKIIGLFCKRDLWKRRYSAKETYYFKEPTNRSHPIVVMLRIWMGHVSHMSESRHTCECIMSRTREWVVLHMCARHVTNMNESCHICECVVSHICRHGACLNIE